MTSLRCHTMLCHRQPHPEEPRPSDALGVNSARRLEGWPTTIMYPTLRDGPAGLLRVRLGPYQHSMKASTSRHTTCRCLWTLIGSTGENQRHRFHDGSYSGIAGGRPCPVELA